MKEGVKERERKREIMSGGHFHADFQTSKPRQVDRGILPKFNVDSSSLC